MSHECFCHKLVCDRSERNRTDEFRKSVQYEQEIFVIPLGCNEFSQNVDGKKLQWIEGGESLHRISVPMEVDEIPGIRDEITYCCVAGNGH